jgi:hypothetical protein
MYGSESDTEVQVPIEEMHRRRKAWWRIRGNISTRISVNSQYAYTVSLGKHGETYIPYGTLGAAPCWAMDDDENEHIVFDHSIALGFF